MYHNPNFVNVMDVVFCSQGKEMHCSLWVTTLMFAIHIIMSACNTNVITTIYNSKNGTIKTGLYTSHMRNFYFFLSLLFSFSYALDLENTRWDIKVEILERKYQEAKYQCSLPFDFKMIHLL